MLTALTIAQENQLPGAEPSQWFFNGTASTAIEGYATQMSVDHGQTIDFKVNTAASAYRLDIYRMGYYNGLGAREVDSIHPTLYLPQGQPAPLIDASVAHDSSSAGLVDAGNWLVTASWAVPQDATSGIYFAKLEREDGGSGTNYIIFVVRNDEGNSDLLFKTSDETWQAYNNWGNSSLYGPGAAKLGRSYKVSYNRPFVQAFGGPLDVFDKELSLSMFLESNGYDVSYTSAIDVAMNAPSLLHHKVFLSVGHDEYWSGEERTNIETARDAGLNLAFLSSNEVFWKTRWESSLDDSHTANRTLVCYKETHEGAKVDPLADTWTGSWRDPRFSPPADGGRPENSLTGDIFTVNYSGPKTWAITVPAAFSNLRFWRNTSIATLAPGTTATLSQATLGGEWDEDLDNGFRPAGLFDMSSTTVDVPAYIQDYGSNYAPGTATHSLTMYRAASGALVFAAGTDEWIDGLSEDDSSDPYTPGKDIRMRQATVNLFADMGAQPTTLRDDLVGAVASTDFTAPVSIITSPIQGSTVQTGIALTIRGTAEDSGGGVLSSVEVSVDGGTTWHRATGLSNWTYTWTPYTTGTVTIKSRAVDDSGNIEQSSAGITIGVTGTSVTMWGDTAKPAVLDTADGQAVELGVKFIAEANGSISGLRFYKSAANTGTHTGSLWTASGQRLATATFSNETASGWQQVNFSTPVAVTAGTTYIASYHTDAGHYSASRTFFDSDFTSGPVNVPASGGVYVYGSGGFPTNSYMATNYWVDVVLKTNSTTDAVAPTVSAFSPANGTSNVSSSIAPAVTFSEAMNSTTVNSTTIYLCDANNAAIATTVAYNSTTMTATLTPLAALNGSTTYTIVVKGGLSGVKDVADNALAAEITSSFTTAPASSLWSTATTPDIVDSGDDQPVELGVKFTSSKNGYISGIRFYKSAANTGTHTASLWDSKGKLLAKVTFTSETAEGWQYVSFAKPVAIKSGKTYVASYYTTVGHYAVTRSYFKSKYTSGPLTVSANGGVYRYGTSGFPKNVYQSSNYWVDPLFVS